MKRIAAIIILLSIAVSSALLRAEDGGKKTGDGAGHFEPDSCILNLGTIPPDRVTEGMIRFRNTGNAPMQILSIFSECGCTSSSYTKDPVEPGDTGEIKVSFNPKGRSAGPFRKALRVRSNADNPRMVIVVKGEVGEQ